MGLMSGTSVDGIDAVVADISGTGQRLQVKLVAHHQRSFPKELRECVLRACLHGTVAELCELNFVLGELFADAALAVIQRARLKPRNIAVIGSHGQTLHHLPRAKTPSTLQLGEPSIIAERTGVTVVADFRVRDMAAGGEGAPLVPYVDWALQTDAKRPRILQNIGGIGNLTFLPARARIKDVVAFDTGPGNMVIDAVVTKLSDGRLSYDKDGRWANKGEICQPLLNALMRHPFLRKTPPKTTGREEFGEPFVAQVLKSAKSLRLSKEDIVATATAFTAESIASAYRRFVYPRMKTGDRKKLQIILGGGGAKNPTLRRMLAERVSPATVLTQDEVGGSNAGKEALAFAVLAYETMQGRPSNVPSATGARRAVVLGKIIPGR